LYTGRLDPVKRCSDLIRAFSRIAERYPKQELVFSGKGAERDKLERLAENSGYGSRIRFEGWVDRERLTHLYATCSAYVLPSLFEGRPVALLEAMASEKPAVVSDAIGNRDTVRDGETGFVVPRKEVSAIAEALEKLLSDPAMRRRMGSRARQDIETNYSFNGVASQVETVVSNIV
jgi:glycosyltransferase involved in cell wall biosynthesis